VDNAGNYGEIGNLTIRLDTLGSYVLINVGSFDEDGWTNGSVAMDYLVFKQGPANNTVHIRVNGGDWVAIGERIYFNESGEYHLEARTVDEANNTGYPASSVHFYIDRTLPISVLNVTGISYATNVYLNSVMVDIQGKDEGKGLDRRMYRINNGTWRAISAPFSLTQAGDYALEYYSVDLVGNREEVRFLNLTVMAAGVPGQVIGLGAEVVGGSIRLSWAAPEDGVLPITAFLVYRSSGSGFELLDTVTGTNYVDEDVDAGVTYSYQVVAVNLLGEGPASMIVDAKVPGEGSNTMMFVIIAIVIVAAVVAGAVMFVRRR